MGYYHCAGNFNCLSPVGLNCLYYFQLEDWSYGAVVEPASFKFQELNKYSPYIGNLNGYLISKANSATHKRFVYSNGLYN